MIVYIERLRNLILKFKWQLKDPRIDKTILKKKSQTLGINFPNVKIHYIAAVIKIVGYCWIDRHID